MMNYWLFEKHKKDIEITGITYKDLRLKIDSETKFKLRKSEDNLFNTLYDWDQIKPSYNFFYDFDSNDNTIKRWLSESELNSSDFIYVETLSNVPIIRTRTEYFISNWLDFIDANVGQGSIYFFLLITSINLLRKGS